jgi:hydroxypyruvate isomerase
VDYPAFFARLDADGYDGWVGADYHPRGATQDGLDWLPSC